MSQPPQLARWLRPLVQLGSNWITLAGTVLTTSAALTMIGFWLFELVSGRHLHPYAGIVIFLILPGVFVFGLLLIPVGIWVARRRRHGEVLPPAPVDLRSPRLQRGFALVGLATLINVLILGLASYRGVEHMDSNEFCGTTCHTVMEPEYTAFVNSPHSRVGCVQCHIGPGASWFVRSKLSGVRQVFAVGLETYSRPIPSPVHELRPARETCEQCHWPAKFHGDKFLVRTSHADDEANTPSTTVLTLHVGGQLWNGAVGIHGRHENITYVTTDGRRQVIARVTQLDDRGNAVEYVSQEEPLTPAQLAAGEQRTMDCMDCHNRPSHTFEMPERAVDEALVEGRISRTLPFVRREAVSLLRQDYPDRERAFAAIEAGLSEFYRANHAGIYREHRTQIQLAIRQVQAIYARNVFPAMKVTWGTYPNNIGHQDFPGCFRCHDGSHVAADGRTIAQDCDSCHSILAMEESNPEVLQQLGLKQP